MTGSENGRNSAVSGQSFASLTSIATVRRRRFGSVSRRQSRARGLLFYRLIEQAAVAEPITYRQLLVAPGVKRRRYAAPPGQRRNPSTLALTGGRATLASLNLTQMDTPLWANSKASRCLIPRGSGERFPGKRSCAAPAGRCRSDSRMRTHPLRWLRAIGPRPKIRPPDPPA